MAENDMTLLPEKGSIGDITIFVRNGKRMVRQRGVPGAKRKLTPRMALQSSKINNVMTAWRSAHGALDALFETRKGGQTAYNAFMSQNLDRARVHLTKEQVRNYWCVADRFVVSLGSLLPTIEVETAGDWLVSDIRVGDTPIAPETTLMDFTLAVLESNADRFHEGDRLTMLLFSQKKGAEQQRHIVEVVAHTIELKTNDMTYLHTTLSTELLCSHEGRLAYPKREGRLVAWVQSRPQPKGPARVTTQCLVGSNALVEQFVGLVPEYKAIVSYGPLKVTHARLPNGMTFSEMELKAQKVIAGLMPAPAASSTDPAPSAPERAGGEDEMLALLEKLRRHPEALALLKEMLNDK